MLLRSEGPNGSCGRLVSGLAGVLLLLVACSPAAASKQGQAAKSNDPYFDRQWGLHNIEAPAAWRIAAGRGTLIAILDTGVDLKHPDLRRKVVVRARADIVDPGSSNGPQDEHGHGTHVAGIAAAVTGNRIGIAGVAPKARILPVRVLNEFGAGAIDWIAEGIRLAADHRADVINLSLGVSTPAGEVAALTGSLRSLKEAISYAWEKGAVIVAAAGNQGVPVCSEPAASEKVVCVGSVGPGDTRPLYSNFDVTTLETYLVAPGGDGSCEGNVLSTLLRSVDVSSCSPRKGYEALAGTSMAAPHVSGVAALLASQGLTNEEIVNRLISTADDLGLEGKDPIYGYGRLNALRAVTER